MLCTDNPYLVLLLWVFCIIISPLIIILMILSYFIYRVYNLITCQLLCCNSMQDEFGDRFDTTAPHYDHNHGTFKNYWKSYVKEKWYEWILVFFVDMSPQKPIDYDSTEPESTFALEYDTINWEKIYSFHYKNNIGFINYLWFGHSSCLIQVDGFNILTDPMFSDRSSAIQCIGPKRYDNLSKYRDDIYKSLPIIDVLVISHDHYDHLDYNTLRTLNAANKVNYFAVPLRIKPWLMKQCNVSSNKIIELDWYYSTVINKKGFDAKEFVITKESSGHHQNIERMNINDDELKIICVPTQHFSGRTLYDGNYRLWCGWLMISSNNKKIYFGGDTGCCTVPRKDKRLFDDCVLEQELDCCPVFTEIGEKYGPIDLGLIPIGAYSPRWFTSRVHLNPFDACFVHKEIKAIKSVGIHWGSFYLTDEDYDEPPKKLKKAMVKYNLKDDEFIVVKHGSITKI